MPHQKDLAESIAHVPDIDSIKNRPVNVREDAVWWV